MIRSILFTIFLVLNLQSFGQGVTPPFIIDHNKKWVDSIFRTLTLEEKIGQLLLPRGNYSGKPHDIGMLKKWVTDYKIGGIVFFASNPTTQASITNELQALSRVPLFIGQDFEWGVGMRLDSTDRFPYAATIGAIKGDDHLVEEMGKEVARQCKRIGVHINYAPVVDVNNNPNNPVINFRSFGSDKYQVTAKGLAYMKGMQSQRLFCTAKHFPGHGDTDADSHHALPLINHDKKRLHDIELYPFRQLIDHGLSGIMTAHLNIPALEPQSGLASTFSKNIITNLLKEELGFQGLTFTDAMEMEGAVKNFPKGEAMVQAILAGNDVLETFMDVPQTVEAIKNAIKTKKLSISLLDAKVKKILMAKSWVGLDQYAPISIENLVQDLNTVNSDILNQVMTEKSITCLNNNAALLPVTDFNKTIAVISMESDKPESDLYQMITNYAKADNFYIAKNATVSYADSIVSFCLQEYDIVVAGIHLIDIRASRKYGLTPENTQIISKLANDPKVILCLFGNPFILAKIPGIKQSKSLIMAYQQNIYAERAAGQIIFGALSPEGRFPLDIDDYFKQGMGTTYPKLDILSYGLPEQVGVDRKGFYSGIDSLVILGIKEKAYPGAVVQVVKDGKVIFSKSYGYHTFEMAEKAKENSISDGTSYTFIDDAMDNPESLTTTLKPAQSRQNLPGKVRSDDIYDLASVTKISTSTLAVMQLMSEKKFNLDARFGDYYPEFNNTDKGGLIMRDLLTHRAGLKAWIPFWRDAIDTIATMKKSLTLQPELEQLCMVKIKKPGFFKRLFGKKTTREILYIETIRTKPELWAKMLRADTRVWKPNVFMASQSPDFNVRVDKYLYLHKDYKSKIIQQIATSPLNPSQGYVYSDLHYYVYPDMVASMTGIPFERYLDETYKAIGAQSLTYNPLQKFPSNRIVPTEYDSIFRQVLIHGFVHDEGASMMGGISGHAGLFGNANDLTKLMQMYLQKGSYGGKRFFRSEVIDLCTKYQFPELKNRRGIGFDKKDFNPEIKNGPSLASDQSYGHSGFTGTFTWVDPVYNIVYVFLSNRVYPTRNNSKISELGIRSELGNVIIKSILKGYNSNL